MKIICILFGKTTEPALQDMIDTYVERIRHRLPLEFVVVPALRNTASLSEAQQKQQELALLEKQLQAGDHVVLLDEHGQERTSMQFAQWLGKRLTQAPRRLVLVVGGPYGFAPGAYEHANEKISLSQMTFSHQMIRLLLVEQIYRALTILHGEPYHHE